MGITRINDASGEPGSESSYDYLLPPTTCDLIDELKEGEGGGVQCSDDANPGNPITWDTDNEGHMWRGILTNT